MSAAFHRQAATRRSRIPLPLLTAHSSARYVAVSLYAPSCDASISPLRPHAPCIRRRLRLLISLPLYSFIHGINDTRFSFNAMIFGVFARFSTFSKRFWNKALSLQYYRQRLFHVKHFELSTLFYPFCTAFSFIVVLLFTVCVFTHYAFDFITFVQLLVYIPCMNVLFPAPLRRLLSARSPSLERLTFFAYTVDLPRHFESSGSGRR